MYATEPRPKLLTPVEAGAFLGIKPQTLAVWRSTHRYDLPVVHVGRSIRYRISDLETWLAARTSNQAE